MTTPIPCELVRVPVSSQALAVCAESADRVQTYLGSAQARNTIRGYRSSFLQFERWCRTAGAPSLPASAEMIAMYIGAQAGRLKPGTLEHHLAAISKAHKAAGFASPVRDNILVAETLKGIKRTHGVAVTRKAPVLTEDLRSMLRETLPDGLLGARDRALLLIGFSGAFRRSELVALNVSDMKNTPEGLLLTIRRSKTDQEGEGRDVAIPYGQYKNTCPVLALQTWLLAAAITEGPLFRQLHRGNVLLSGRLSGHGVGRVVKKYAKATGLTVKDFSGHSLRAGFVTSAARAGEPERRIMRQTGHKSIEMVLRYVRQANAFTDNSALALGL
jgi:integrase